MGKMNLSVITGFVCCFGMILVGIMTNGGIQTIVNFMHIPSLIITIGGTVFAVLITSESFGDFADGMKSFGKAFGDRPGCLDEIGNAIYEMATIARKEGLLQLEERMSQVDDEFFKKGLRLVVDGMDSELIKDLLETELLHLEEENRRQVLFWENMGAYAPAWGMVGTLLGLINMMKSMGADSSAIGAGMSLALITTLYGSVFANWICIPISGRIKRKGSQEEMEKALIIEGVLSIQAGDNPMVIKEKIRTFRGGWEEKILPDS